MWWGCSVAAQCPLTCKRPPEAECGANNTEVRSAPLFDYLPGPASNLSLLPCSVTMSPVLLLSLYYAEMSSSSLPSPCLSCITSSIEDSPFPSSQTSFIVPSPFLSLYTFISEFVSFFFFQPTQTQSFENELPLPPMDINNLQSSQCGRRMEIKHR